MKDLFNYIVKLKYTYADDDFLVLIIQSFLRKPETASWTEAAVRIREARNGLSLWGIWLWWRATVNEICGGAIIWQLVCNGLLLLNVNTKGSHWSFLSGTRCPEQGNIFQTQSNWESTSTLPLFFAGCCTKKPTLECHESRFKPYSPDRSNLSSMYHRNKSMGSKKEKGRAMRKEERKKKRRENLKEEIPLSHHWMAPCYFLRSIHIGKNDDFARITPCDIR